MREKRGMREWRYREWGRKKKQREGGGRERKRVKDGKIDEGEEEK